MDREQSSSGRPSGTATRTNHFLEWIQDQDASEPHDRPADPPATKAADSSVGAVVDSVDEFDGLADELDSALTVVIDGTGDAAPVAPARAGRTTAKGATKASGKTRPQTASKPGTKPLTARPVKQTVAERAWWQSRKLAVAVAVAVVAVVSYGVYAMGNKPSVPGISGKPSNAPSASATAVDSTKVAALMKAISANPKDVTSLQSLGDLYFQAGDYKTAAGWEQKILDVSPKNITALLALGASQFNLGDTVAAEKNWQQVVTINPRQVEAHYDLGFLYLSKEPPDMAKVRAEWNKVVEIDPNSDVAKSVKQHLQSLNSKTTAPTTGK